MCDSARNPADAGEEYRLCDLADTRHAATQEFDSLAARIVRQPLEPVPPPPRWRWMSGLLTFLLYPSTLASWVPLALGLSVIGGLVKLSASPWGFLYGPFYPFVIVFSVFVSAYLAAYALTIVHETAHGYDAIQHWPGWDVREWVWSLLRLLWVLAVCVALCLPWRWLLPAAGISAETVVLFVVFPWVLLSTLEANSMWMVFSVGVWRSLRRGWRDWIVFYLLSGLLWYGWTLLLAWALDGADLRSAVLVLGPGLAAVLFVYARLLGRLAWCLGSPLPATGTGKLPTDPSAPSPWQAVPSS